MAFGVDKDGNRAKEHYSIVVEHCNEFFKEKLKKFQ